MRKNINSVPAQTKRAHLLLLLLFSFWDFFWPERASTPMVWFSGCPEPSVLCPWVQVHLCRFIPQHAALRVVCFRNLFSPLLLTPPRLVLSVLASLCNVPWSRFLIFSVNWGGIKLSSFYFWPEEEKLIQVPGMCHQPQWKKIKPILSIIVSFVIDIIIILRTHWGPLIMLLKSMFSLCTSFSNLGKIQNFW